MYPVAFTGMCPATPIWHVYGCANRHHQNRAIYLMSPESLLLTL